VNETTLRNSLLAIEMLQQRLRESEESAREPIAIAGMACRFPGASSPAQFWELLTSGSDAIGEVPADRWDSRLFYDPDPSAAGKVSFNRGAFLTGIDQFDAGFFGLSPREAASLDPQQRLLLEVAWEALEDAGESPAGLRESATGVFLGMGQFDYARHELFSGDLEAVNTYSGTGNGLCFAGGRLSYFLGLRGPSMVVDTACSSSLVAVHLACQSLRTRESNLAIAAGVHLILSPEVAVFLSRTQAVAPDGVSKVFDAAADGYGRGEGCGVVILKRLKDALADGNRILGVIRGSAVNHNGHGSGLTVPNAQCQQALLRQALNVASVAPGQISFMEAHGTGTVLGDPIEMRAMGAALGEELAGAPPIPVTAVKANIGHLEAAAGIASLIKGVLALRHRQVPRQIHYQTPNPHIPWNSLPFFVPQQNHTLAAEGVLRAGISSFGISGTNAHVILESAPPPAVRMEPSSSMPHLLALSARSPVALRVLAGSYREHLLRQPTPALEDVCYTANTGRAHHPYRAAFIAADTAELVAQISAFLTSPPLAELPETAAGGPPAAIGAASREDLVRLARMYERGAAILWSEWARQHPGQRIALPTYPFERSRHWVSSSAYFRPRAQERPASVHPLLGSRLDAAVEDLIFEARIGDSSPEWVAAHRVFDTAVLPATAYVEMALQAGFSAFASTRLEIEEIRFETPLLIQPSEASTVQTVVSKAQDPSVRDFRIAARGRAGEPWITHARGRLVSIEDETPPAAATGTTEMEAVLPEELYSRYAGLGLNYGERFRVLSDVRRGAAESYATIALKRESADGYWVHPALLDGCLQLLGASHLAGTQAAAYVPASARHIRIRRAMGARCECHASLRATPEGMEAELQMTSPDGAPLASIGSVSLRRAESKSFLREEDESSAEWFYEVCWKEQALHPETAATGLRWLIAAGSRAGVAPLVERLLGAGGGCDFDLPDGSSAAYTGVVFMPDAAEREPWGPLLELLHRLEGRPDQPRLFVITHGVQNPATHALGINLWQSPLWGLGRTIASEHPEFRATLIDLPVEPDRESLECLAAQLLAAGRETEIAIRSGKRYVARLVRGQQGARASRIRLPRAGVLEGFLAEPMKRTPPGPDQVEIEVLATGLNFKDVLIALGRFELGDGAGFGFECAGIVARTGRAVTAFRPGDRVVGFLAVGCLNSFVSIPEDFVTHVPQGLSMADAAVQPIAYLTAWYALHHVAGVARGESILIHSAAGGVGLAAVQIAQAAGLEIYATASRAKWNYLEGLGTRNIADSRSLDFRETIHAATGGAGATIVLNSLSGEFIPAGLTLCRPGARFIELGKDTGWDGARVEREFPGVRYLPFDLFDVAQQNPSLIASMWKQIAARLESGEFRPLPSTAYPVAEAAAAFRHFAVAAHTGKLAITRSAPVHPDAAYLISGGLGNLGLHVAAWLAARGARRLALISRHEPGELARKRIRELESAGVSVEVRLLDVSDRAALHSLLDELEQRCPLRGVFHAAGDLDDGVMRHQTAARFGRVMRPKADGGWNLHLWTMTRHLDFFVCFSSAASLFGTPGQGNYAAANAFLDALAHHRRALGLPAVTIDWGPWQGGGMASVVSHQNRQRWSGLGIETLPPDEALSALDRILASGSAQSAVMRVRWADFSRSLQGRTAPLFDDLLTPVSAQPQPAYPLLLLRAAPAGERLRVLTELVRNEVAATLGLPSGTHVGLRARLFDLGLDSLMALEFKNRMEFALQQPFSSTLVFDHPTVEALAAHLLALLFPAGKNGVVHSAEADTESGLADLLTQAEGMSEEDMLRDLIGARRRVVGATE
jgi:acyl transferase domain-containing protein/NADPH:quinone reductase-like Zn-dependent oxidoreductase